MIKSKKAESITTVIVGVVILSFIILTLATIIIDSRKKQKLFENHRFLNILRNNTSNIISKLNTDSINEDDKFYIYKDNIGKNFITVLGDPSSTHISHENKYINKYGDKVNINNYEGNIYQRFLWLERVDTSIDGETNQIIKAVVKRLIRKN